MSARFNRTTVWTKLFGARESYVEFLADIHDELQMEVKGHQIFGRFFFQAYESQAGGTAAGHYPDGKVAAVANTSGKGRTLLIGSFPGGGYYKHHQASTRTLFADFLKLAGITPRVTSTDNEVQARVHMGEAGTNLWVINPTRAAKNVVVTLQAELGRFTAGEDRWNKLPRNRLWTKDLGERTGARRGGHCIALSKHKVTEGTNIMSSSRREFIGYTFASAATLLGLPSEGWAQASQGTHSIGPPMVNWYSKPMRWAQVGFAEDDPGNYNQQFWVDYFKRCHVDAVTLNAGGAVAFYPTEVQFHYRSKWLGKMDTFGDLAKACRSLGMVVVARTDAHACHQDVVDAHPDWIMVDASGKKVRHPSDPDFWLTCPLGPYNFEFMTAVHEEIMRFYMVDGIFTNRWAGSGMCYCIHCQEQFKAFSGLALPRTRDPQDPARKQYIVWRQKRLFELWKLWNSRIQAINPNASYIANAGGGALSELDMKTVGELAPTLFADRQGRSGLMPPWANGKNGKEYRATLGNKAIVGIFSMGLEDKYRWKDSVQGKDEIRLWVADGIAQNLRPWFTKFDAKVIDPRWLPVVEEIYVWHAANEAYLRNEGSLAQVGLVYSQQTASYYGGEQAKEKVEDPEQGFYEALIEARIPFDMVHDHLLDAEHLRQYHTLILPNIAALSKAQCQQLEAFVQAGGGLVATYQTSLFDEWGVAQPNFGLASLFGCNYAGKVEGPMLNSYLNINKEVNTGHPHELVKGFEDASRIINGAYQVVITPMADGVYPLQVEPTYPDLPMEEVFPRKDTVRTMPGAIVRQVGKGRVVYLPGDIDRTFWETMNVDQLMLLQNCVRWVTNVPEVLKVEGKGILDVSVWTQSHSMTVHLVNLTNPMMMKGPIREIIPITGQQVRVQMPPGKTVKDLHLLVAKSKPKYNAHDGFVELEVPSIAIHEVIAIDFA